MKKQVALALLFSIGVASLVLAADMAKGGNVVESIPTIEIEDNLIPKREIVFADRQEELTPVGYEPRLPNVSRGGSLIQTTYNKNSQVNTKSGLIAAQLDQALAGTGLEDLGKYFIKAEEMYGINAVFLTAIAALESGWGRSRFAQERNNLFGFGAWDSNPNNAAKFDSKGEAILYVGEYLSRIYLDSEGRHYNGATPSGVNVKYCTSSDWTWKIVDIMNTITRKATN